MKKIFHIGLMMFLGVGLVLITANFGKSKNHWTIFFYAGACSSTEGEILRSIAEIKRSFVDNQGLELIVLIDRIAGYSDDQSVLGENFNDTRLYRITRDKAERLHGGTEFPEITKTSNYDADMGDAKTLKKFIYFGMAHFPAPHYALFVYGHSTGFWVCNDEESDQDALYTAEFTDVLSPKESVDLLAFDASWMGGVENLYQWRPGNGTFNAGVIIASSPTTDPWRYDKIFERLKAGGGEDSCDPDRLTDLDFGRLILEEIKKSKPEESWSCYDLTKVENLKKAIDGMAQDLASEGKREDLELLRGSGVYLRTMNYLARPNNLGWFGTPYFDVYDLAKRIAQSEQFSEKIKGEGRNVMSAVDDVIVSSYGWAEDYPGYENGKHGLYIFFPAGERMVNGQRHWAYQINYSPLDMRNEPPVNLFSRKIFFNGGYFWCRDGAIPGNNKVENWFELLDSWYDTGNGKDGGLNKYQW